ncbi:hypothetical protein [Streptomyces sp. Ac-502]|uniref:hypothetical protein n=1 Tax=Streptomyces sp. Ac-502 TaxID=3342801 RepID=UPI0038623C10
MKKTPVTYTDFNGNPKATPGLAPDFTNALIHALNNQVKVEPPQHAQNFDDLIDTLAQTSRVIQHLEAFRELVMVAADKTSPHADRKAIAIAAAMPPPACTASWTSTGSPPTARPLGRQRPEHLGQSGTSLAQSTRPFRQTHPPRSEPPSMTETMGIYDDGATYGPSETAHNDTVISDGIYDDGAVYGPDPTTEK